MAKRAVNHTMDIQGYTNSIDSIFDMHHFGHTRARVVTGGMPSIAGLATMKQKGREAMNLDGASAIVTGGAGGLGAATVRRLLAGGLRVVVFDRDAERAEALAAELGAGAVGVGGDVLDDDDVAAAIVAARTSARCRCWSTWRAAAWAAVASSAARAPTTRARSSRPSR